MAYPAKKIAPARTSTASLADIVYNLKSMDCGALYLNTTSHYYPYSKKGDDEVWKETNAGYNIKSVKECHVIVIDVDNFPLSGFAAAEEKTNALFAKYEFLKKFPPTYITDTGKKGFQAFYVFEQNIWQKGGLQEIVTAVCAFFLNADRCCVKKAGQFRVPFSSRYDGNDCSIIFHAGKYDFREFSQSMIRYAKRFVITYDGFVLKNSGMLSDDVAYTVCDYLTECYKIKKSAKKQMKKRSRGLKTGNFFIVYSMRKEKCKIFAS